MILVQKDYFGLYLMPHKVRLSRLKIISILKKNSFNTNQLTKELSLDYKAIQHHLKVLEKNNLITKVGKKYTVQYFISNLL